MALFDAGFASEHNFTADLPVELALIAVEREARQTGRLDDNHSTTTWQAMATRLADPANQKRYKRRGVIIEPSSRNCSTTSTTTCTCTGTPRC